jgi:L-gulono-1,4-lactone dehydrogenase
VAELWTNWAGEQTCAPERIARPRSETELAELVGAAAVAGTPIRVAGSGHSFTDCACTDGLMIDIGRMDRVLEADPESGMVTVEAGITLHELGAQLAARGLAMENQGDIDAQTLAGAISTATHGTGSSFGNLSSQVRGVRLVTAVGEVAEITSESDPEALLAARVGLGALGAISAVTLQAVPLFTITRVDEPRPLAETLDALPELIAGSDHFEFYVFPYTDLALTRTSTRSDRDPRPRRRRKVFVEEVIVENGAVDLIGRIGRRSPRAAPRLNRAVAGAISKTVTIDRSHRVYASRRTVRFNEMEYALPAEHGQEAVRRVLELVERRRMGVTFPIEVRTSAGDDAHLSTAFGRETVYVAVHQYRGVDYETYFRAVEAIMDDYDGRPHWGKRHYQSAATLAPRYPAWERFKAVRDRLDSGRAFANDHTRRVLGP